MTVSAVCSMSCRRMNDRIEMFHRRRCRPMLEVLIPCKYTVPAWEKYASFRYRCICDMSEDVCLFVLTERVVSGFRSCGSVLDDAFSILETKGY